MWISFKVGKRYSIFIERQSKKLYWVGYNQHNYRERNAKVIFYLDPQSACDEQQEPLSYEEFQLRVRESRKESLKLFSELPPPSRRSRGTELGSVEYFNAAENTLTISLDQKLAERLHSNTFDLPSEGYLHFEAWGDSHQITQQQEELAAALGLDPIFIRNTYNDLISLENLNQKLQITEEGRKSLSLEKVSEGSQSHIWYFIQDPVLGDASFSRYPLDDIDEDRFEDLSSYVQKDLTQFPSIELQPAALQLEELGLDLHNPDEGRFVTAMEQEGEPQLCWRPIAIFVVHDRLSKSAEKSLSIQARTEDLPLPIIVEWLEAQIQQRYLSLKMLFGLDDEAFAQEEQFQPGEDTEKRLAEERLEEIRQQAAHQLRLQVEGQTLIKGAETAVQLRDVEIRPAFLSALQRAREQIIIYSPWINELVVDDEFLALMENCVQKGVHILIGYGIGRDEQREERPMPPRLRQRLRSIQTAEGTPGVIAEWLGNSHAKEVIIDGTTHFSGSHNWLSYRGDRFPRGETVYQVTIAEQVEKAYNHLARRFIEHAQLLWSKATEEECCIALCVLCSLGHEQDAVEWLQRDIRYYFIPFWLRLARQSITTRHEARILVPLQSILTLCLTAIDSQDPLRAEIGNSLRDVLALLKSKNQKLTTHFVNENDAKLRQLGLLPL
jgi:hypothetical protein